MSNTCPLNWWSTTLTSRELILRVHFARKRGKLVGAAGLSIVSLWHDSKHSLNACWVEANSCRGTKCSVSFPSSGWVCISSSIPWIGKSWGGKDQIVTLKGKNCTRNATCGCLKRRWMIHYEPRMSTDWGVTKSSCFSEHLHLSLIKSTLTLWANFDLHHCPPPSFFKKATFKFMEQKLDLNLH